MRHRLLVSTGALTTVIAFVSLPPVAVSGQSPTASKPAPTAQPKPAASKAWTLPRTPWGDPDLQGVWNNGTITPLERPQNLAGRETLTAEEIAAAELDAHTRDDRPPREGDVGFYNAVWWDRGKSTGRTALIIDPPDGRIPPLTPEGQKRLEERRLRFGQTPAARATGFSGPEDLTLTERCIQYAALPRVPTGYNNNYEIVQAPGYAVILQEEIHEARIAPLDGRPHLPTHMRQYLGDSRGRWEGNTLVIETTNFHELGNFRGSGGNLHLIERFTRIDADTIDYQFTVADPTTWTRPWTAAIPMEKTDGPMLEYACHEGNYAMENILSAARVAEKAQTSK